MYVHPTPFGNRLAAFTDRHQVPLASAIAIAFLLWLHHSYNFYQYHYDSAEYWTLAYPGMLSNLRTSRGYFWPTLLTPLSHLHAVSENPVQTYRTGMAIFYGVVLTTLVPAAFQRAFGGKVNLVRRLVPVVLLAALFPGLLLYPLSDLPALLLAMGALLCVLRGLDESASTRRFAGLMVAAGVLMGAAYNTRTIYLFGLILMLVFVAVRGRRVKTNFPRWLGLLAFTGGAFLVSLPQLAVNQRTHNVSSLAVQASGGAKGLFVSQMVWGMTLQRYETTLHPGAPAPSVFYFDPAGARLFDEVSRKGDLFSLRYYIKVMAQHPLEFLALYTRHVINGLDLRDGLVYTLKSSAQRKRTAIFNFLVLALAVGVAFTIRSRRPRASSDGFTPVPATWPFSLAVLLISVAAIVPGAVETRFFLPLHLLAYCVIAMHFEAATLREGLKRHAPVVLLALVASAGIFFAVTFNTMANAQYNWPVIYREGPPR